MSEDDKLYPALDMIECGRIYNQSKECYEKAYDKKAKEECYKIYKKYQFCVAEAETERLNQGKYWQEFKDKWGHYPNEAAKE